MTYKLLSLLFSILHISLVLFGLVYDNEPCFILGCMGVGVFAYINTKL